MVFKIKKILEDLNYIVEYKYDDSVNRQRNYLEVSWLTETEKYISYGYLDGDRF